MALHSVLSLESLRLEAASCRVQRRPQADAHRRRTTTRLPSTTTTRALSAETPCPHPSLPPARRRWEVMKVCRFKVRSHLSQGDSYRRCLSLPIEAPTPTAPARPDTGPSCWSLSPQLLEPRQLGWVLALMKRKRSLCPAEGGRVRLARGGRPQRRQQQPPLSWMPRVAKQPCKPVLGRFLSVAHGTQLLPSSWRHPA